MTERLSIIALRTRIRQERERLLEEAIGAEVHAANCRERAEQLTRLLTRTEPARGKRFRLGDELTEIG